MLRGYFGLVIMLMQITVYQVIEVRSALAESSTLGECMLQDLVRSRRADPASCAKLLGIDDPRLKANRCKEKGAVIVHRREPDQRGIGSEAKLIALPRRTNPCVPRAGRLKRLAESS